MYKIRAERIAVELKGKEVDGWLIGEYINNGKSALLMHCSKNDVNAAIKIFDKELIDNYGRDVQLERIAREKSLVGKEHPNLIKILDGGYCSKTENCFVVMEYLAGTTLSESLDKIPKDKIGKIILELASAAKFLEDLGLAHRDIKPDNIMLSEDGNFTPTLLDLGVLRLDKDEKYTDISSKPFIGTLQYSSPEFLLRQEESSPEGWRAVTFYQLGAVLHDMIMKRPIFESDSEPFGLLVKAIMFKTPDINAFGDTDLRLISLAKNCLVKSPDARLDIVNWDDFELVSKPSDKPEEISSIKESIRKLKTRSISQNNKSTSSNNENYERILQEAAQKIMTIISSVCITDTETFPPIKKNNITRDEHNIENVILTFEPSEGHALYGHLSICISIKLLNVEPKIFEFRVEAKNGIKEILTSEFEHELEELIYKGNLDQCVQEKIEYIIYEKFKETIYELESGVGTPQETI